MRLRHTTFLHQHIRNTLIIILKIQDKTNKLEGMCRENAVKINLDESECLLVGEDVMNSETG